MKHGGGGKSYIQVNAAFYLVLSALMSVFQK